MRLMILIMVLSTIYLVQGKNNLKTLTDTKGQDVIEIGNPIKELPMGLDEEPSAEDDDDDEKASLKTTVDTPVPATKKDTKKSTTPISVKINGKDDEKTDRLIQDEEEARIEKELAEIYKDTADYKTDSAEEKVAKQPLAAPVEQAVGEDTSAEESDKPIGRDRNNFKFQPDSTNQASIEKFRTSVDEISCNNRQKLSGTQAPPGQTSTKSDAFGTISNGMILITAVLSYVVICT